MNRNSSVCNIKIDKNNYLKNRTVCKRCDNKNRRNNNNNASIQKEFVTSHQQSTIEHVNNNKNNVNNHIVSTCENHAYVVIGPINIGKIYYILK